MTFEQLRTTAKEHKAIYTSQLPKAWQNELLAMADYLAESNEYEPDYTELHDDILTSKITDLSYFFKAFEEEINGKKFGVFYPYNGHTDELTNNNIGFDFVAAYEVKRQLCDQGYFAKIYEFAKNKAE